MASFRGRRGFPRTAVPTRRMAMAVALPAFLLVVTTLPTPPAASAPADRSSPGVYYAVAKAICPPPTRRHPSCFAMRIVHVKRGTPGARAFVPAAGAAPSAARSGPAATVGPAGGLTPSDLAHAYGFSSSAPAAGQTVAVVDAFNDPDIDGNLQTFDSQYGLSACSKSNGCLRVVNQSGGTALPPDDTTGWSAEESLDVETVHSVCQNCKILLVEATNDSSSNLDAAVDEAVKLKATEISNSYGQPEAGSTAADEAAYNHPGVVITVSSGDDGYYSFDLLGSSGTINQPDEPASFNTVVAVGGTSLYLGQTATRQSETVWNDNGLQDIWETLIGLPLGAGGGGCSTLVAAKSWQTSLSVWKSTGCGTHRLVADIAADADPFTGFDIYDSYDYGSYTCDPSDRTSCWQTVGGTSLASPIIAAMFALAGGAHGVAYPALTLYGHLGSHSLYDVTSGGNGFCDGEGAAECNDPNPNTLGYGIVDCAFPASGTTPSAGDRACDAAPGYDGPSGVGTPNGLGAFAKLAPTVRISGPSVVTLGTTNLWTARTHDPFPGGVVVRYRWRWGDGSVSILRDHPAVSHRYGRSGQPETITLTVTDNYGQSATTTLTVKVTA